MALSFIGVTSKVGEADGEWDIPIHASAAADDTAIIFYANDAVISPTLSGDSDLIVSAAPTTSVSIRGWSKVLTAGEITAGAITLTDSGGNGLSGACVMGVWRGAGEVGNGTVSLQSSNTDTHGVSNTGLTSGGHYFAVAFLDDDLTTVSGYPTDYASSRSSLQCGTAGTGGTLAWARAESLPTNTNEFVFNSSDTGVSFAFQIAALIQISAGSGSFTLTGADVAFEKTESLAAGAGSFVLVGGDASLLPGQYLTAETGTFAFTGADAELIDSPSLSADAGSFTLTGATATLLRSIPIIAESGSFILTGRNIRQPFIFLPGSTPSGWITTPAGQPSGWETLL